MNITLTTGWVGALLMSSQLLVAQQAVTPRADTTKPLASTIANPKSAPEKNELKYNLNESGTHFFKATFLNQAWLQWNQSNPGSTVIGVPKDNTFSIGLRRTRM